MIRGGKYPDIDQHIYFVEHDSPYKRDVVLETVDGVKTRYMMDENNRRKKFNISKWDADVIERLKTLPDHVRVVLSV